jgi:hypothetical protein
MSDKVAANPTKLFIIYSHQDKAWKEELELHLKQLRDQGAINKWGDGCICEGVEWDAGIMGNFEGAGIILLLISDCFLAERSIRDVELKAAYARHEKRTARVIPVILRAVEWQESLPYGLQALPRDGKTIHGWEPPERGFADVARGVRSEAEDQWRAGLLGALSRLVPAEMAFVLVRIKGAASRVAHNVSDLEKAADLFRWAESANGPGLGALQRALDELRVADSRPNGLAFWKACCRHLLGMIRAGQKVCGKLTSALPDAWTQAYLAVTGLPALAWAWRLYRYTDRLLWFPVVVIFWAAVAIYLAWVEYPRASAAGTRIFPNDWRPLIAVVLIALIPLEFTGIIFQLRATVKLTVGTNSGLADLAKRSWDRNLECNLIFRVGDPRCPTAYRIPFDGTDIWIGDVDNSWPFATPPGADAVRRAIYLLPDDQFSYDIKIETALRPGEEWLRDCFEPPASFRRIKDLDGEECILGKPCP